MTKCENPFSTNCPILIQQALSTAVGFDEICNGILEYLPDLYNNTDESDCLIDEWSCMAERYRCDQLWHCPDGRDELGCNIKTVSSLYCNNTAHFCLDINNGEQRCVLPKNVNDGKIDCIGSLDERDFCRQQYPHQLTHRYRCRNANQCISFYDICDCKQDCPENDDETLACTWSYNKRSPSDLCGIMMACDIERSKRFDGRREPFCNIQDTRSNTFWRWHQIATPNVMISSKNSVQRQRRSDESLDPAIIWTCNRGLYVRSNRDSTGFACFCPDYYYGDRCQYQRKRIKLILRMQMISSFNNRHSTYKFLVLLVQINQTSKNIVDHHQFIYMPRFQCLPKVYVPLLYPLKEPYRSYANHSIHIHMFDIETFEHRYTWIFSLKFEFLPLQIIVKRLLVPEMGTYIEGKQLSVPYQGCKNTCSNQSRCLGHDVNQGRDICLCSLGYIGRRCFIPFDPCVNRNCSGHGRCQAMNVFRDRRKVFECVCEAGWYGDQCQYTTARISITLNRDLTYLSRSMAFLHIINLFSSEPDLPRFIYFQHSQKETMNLTFMLTDTNRIFDGAFIQFYEHQFKYDYYYLYIRELFENQTIKHKIVNLKASHRCRSVNELFKKDILSQPPMLRVKSYQRPCRMHHFSPLLCFYDDHLMCICHKRDHRAHCFPFQTDLNQCDSKWCNGRGMCVQDHYQCPVSSQCLCEPCAYGSFCQFTTAGYTLSLDSIIGSHISIVTINLLEQSRVIQIAFGLVLTIVVCGIILNLLSICTFVQSDTQEVGCGLYLLVSSIVGLFTVMILMSKMILLLIHHQNNFSCAFVEYLLKWCPISCEWLNTGVAIERTIAVKRPAQYSRRSSRIYSKWIAPLIILFVASMSLPDLFYRRIIIDPLDDRTWCVLTLNHDRLTMLRFFSSWNILAFLIPFVINISSAIFIIIGTFRLKQKFLTDAVGNKKDNASWKTHFDAIRNQIRQHKHIFLTPIVLAILSLPHVIITFIFVCTKLDQNSIPSLIAYLVGFLPTMAIPLAFIVPSSAYRKAFTTCMQKLMC